MYVCTFEKNMPKFVTVWTDAGVEGPKVRIGLEQMGTPSLINWILLRLQ